MSVLVPRRFLRLFVSDALNVSRDPVLILATALSVLPAIGLWLWMPAMDEAAAATFGIERFSRYIAPVALMLPAALIGWVAGFLLLEDRDENLLPALEVTPVGKAGFLAYRVTITALLSAAVTIPTLSVVAPGLDVTTATLLIALVPANAVLNAVVLPALARNKVEGLALTKLTNLAMIVPLLAAVPSPWRFAAAIFPSYWIGEVLGLGTAPLPLAIVASVAIAVHFAWTAAMFRLFIKRAP